jgi:hypothetical protein
MKKDRMNAWRVDKYRQKATTMH